MLKFSIFELKIQILIHIYVSLSNFILKNIVKMSQKSNIANYIRIIKQMKSLWRSFIRVNCNFKTFI
jgi:isopropylmalate/homocitrate/citramalate synthase